MAEIDELREKLTNIRTKAQQIADNLNVPYTAGEMTLTEIGSLLDEVKSASEETGGISFDVSNDETYVLLNVDIITTCTEVE